jgi:hypothetical protein
METTPPELPVEATPAPTTSLLSKLFNVFATPGDVFEEVIGSKINMLIWILPTLIVLSVALGSVGMIFSNENVVRQVREQQNAAMEKKLKDLPKAQQDQAKAAVEQFTTPGLLKTFAIFGAGISVVVWVFLVAFLVWLAGKLIFKAEFPYVKSLEVCGLAGMVNVIGGIVGTFLIIAKGNIYANAGPVLFLADFNTANKTHMLLASYNVVTIWYIAVLGIGLAKLSRCSAMKAFLVLLMPWAVIKFCMIWVSMGS